MNIRNIRIKELISWKKQKSTAIGLDIGKDSVKLVELIQEEDDTIKLNKIDSAKTAGLTQTQAIKNAVAQLLARNNVKDKEMILGIKGQSVFIKFLEVLPVGTERLERTIRYEVQQQIPFSLEEVEWDTHLFQTKEVASRYPVLLVAIKKDRLTQQLNLAQELGLTPSILDVSSVSIYNSIRFNQDFDPNKVTIVLDMGAQSSDLLILKDGNLWMRSFAVGGDNFTSALEKKFNMDFAQAEKFKQGIDIANIDIKEAIGSVLEDLKGEVSRSIEYYYFQQRQGARGEAQSPEQTLLSGTTHIGEILLSGGACLLSGLDKFLAENFSCRVKRVNPFKGLKLDVEIKSKINSQSEILFSHAVGLALRGLNKSYININLLKEQIKAKALTRQRLLLGAGSVILALLILFSASTFMRQDYRKKNSQLDYLKNLLNTFSTYQVQVDQLQQKQELLSRQVNALQNLTRNRALWFEVLMELQRMLPDDSWITEFVGTTSFDISEEVTLNKLDLGGKATSYAGVNNFVSSLKSSRLFTEVKPLSSAFIEERLKGNQKREVVKFSISMKVKPLHPSKIDIALENR